MTKNVKISDFLLFAMLCISAACAVVRCLSVWLSVTFTYCVETSKHIIRHIITLFHLSVNAPFWFSEPNLMSIFRGRIYRTVPFPRTLSDRKIFFDRKHRAASLRQLMFLFTTTCLAVYRKKNTTVTRNMSRHVLISK